MKNIVKREKSIVKLKQIRESACAYTADYKKRKQTAWVINKALSK
ncbi:hypothetical protein ACN6QV_01080 [Bacillus velezensis]